MEISRHRIIILNPNKCSSRALLLRWRMRHRRWWVKLRCLRDCRRLGGCNGWLRSLGGGRATGLNLVGGTSSSRKPWRWLCRWLDYRWWLLWFPGDNGGRNRGQRGSLEAGLHVSIALLLHCKLLTTFRTWDLCRTCSARVPLGSIRRLESVPTSSRTFKGECNGIPKNPGVNRRSLMIDVYCRGEYLTKNIWISLK